MNVKHLLRITACCLTPQTHLDAFGAIIAALVALLGLAAITQLLKGALP